MEKRIVEKTIQILQLFTEGHYIQLQDMLRQQPKNRKNYNMVSRVTELLCSYNNNMFASTSDSQEGLDNYQNINTCLETLNEFV